MVAGPGGPGGPGGPPNMTPNMQQRMPPQQMQMPQVWVRVSGM